MRFPYGLSDFGTLIHALGLLAHARGAGQTCRALAAAGEQ